jgi:hypothetical protein
MAEAWISAAKDLGIEVACPYDLDSQGRTYQYVVLIKYFGSPKGTLVFPLAYRLDEAAVEHGAQKGYFVSSLNEESYGRYDRQLFIDTLNDWGYFGEESERPQWYTGEPWTE